MNLIPFFRKISANRVLRFKLNQKGYIDLTHVCPFLSALLRECGLGGPLRVVGRGGAGGQGISVGLVVPC